MRKRIVIAVLIFPLATIVAPFLIPLIAWVKPEYVDIHAEPTELFRAFCYYCMAIGVFFSFPIILMGDGWRWAVFSLSLGILVTALLSFLTRVQYKQVTLEILERHLNYDRGGIMHYYNAGIMDVFAPVFWGCFTLVFIGSIRIIKVSMKRRMHEKAVT